MILRRLVIALLLALIAGLLWPAYNPAVLVSLALLSGAAVSPTLGPTPPPPTLNAPRGDLPTGHAGLEEWVEYPGLGFSRVGSGFLLRLPEGDVVGVTTAHSVNLFIVQRFAFHLPQSPEALLEFTTYHGPPGRAFHGYRFDVDFVLLKVDVLPEAAPVLTPDPRGRPEPGERVALSSGLGGANGEPRWLAGTVTASSAEAVWVQMDEVFEPGGMSGSPLFSAHTGRVVGMAITARRGDPTLLGFHPIGSLVEKASSANTFPAISNRRSK
ncbi:MAG: serine protease [Anaerolineales bacterium]|nr:serine protease [Anaerolineales bacterium]